MPYSPTRRARLDRRRRWALIALGWLAVLALKVTLYGFSNWVAAFFVILIGTLVVSMGAGNALDGDDLGLFILRKFVEVQSMLVFAGGGLLLTFLLAGVEAGWLLSGEVSPAFRALFRVGELQDLTDARIVYLATMFACAFSAVTLHMAATISKPRRGEKKTPPILRRRLRIRALRPVMLLTRPVLNIAALGFLLIAVGFVAPDAIAEPPVWLVGGASVVALALCCLCWLAWLCVYPCVWWMSLRMVVALAKIR